MRTVVIVGLEMNSEEVDQLDSRFCDELLGEQVSESRVLLGSWHVGHRKEC